MAKRGRMSEEERDFLDRYLESLSDEELAERLDRTIEFVSTIVRSSPIQL